MKKITSTFILGLLWFISFSQPTSPLLPDPNPAPEISGMQLVWAEEFNTDGKPDPESWKYEEGFVRNEELQWYREENAECKDGVLVIEGRREEIHNPNYKPENQNWRLNRKSAQYSSASINTRGKKEWLFGRFEIRARIDTSLGSWPAIWTLGTAHPWPSNGEIDLMEFYRVNGESTILANTAWGTNQQFVAKWNTQRFPLSKFTASDSDWDKKFHIWRMDWTPESIRLFLDDELLNTTRLSETINPDGFNPFTQAHYLLLNLAIGGNGGNPDQTAFPIKYEVDYVRVYQEK